MLTEAAWAARQFAREFGADVLSRAELAALGCTPSEVRARLAAGRWQRLGKAVVLHNGELTRDQAYDAALINCGPRALLGSFTAAQRHGLSGWERPEIHVLAPAGVAAPQVRGLPIILHRTAPAGAASMGSRRCQRIAPALVLAAAGFAGPRPGCGLLAAGVQQRLTTAPDLRAALDAASRSRHRRVLLAAVADIEMGAHALSEIDFVRLCRRHHLPAPAQQAVRRERDGRRRYLDAQWVRADGTHVVVEVDGAVHLMPRRWFDDQLRQNEIVLAGAVVLRYPSVVVRTEELLVVEQLRRALGVRS